MKILDVQQIREADAYTIRHEPIPSIDLMERASRAFLDAFLKHYAESSEVHVFSGVGNNGGDGLVVARLLAGMNYRVKVSIVGDPKKGSADFLANLQKLPVDHMVLSDSHDFPEIPEDAVIVDALFGSGLTRPLSGFFEEVVDFLNHADAVVVALDIASGLFADRPLPEDFIAIRPERTITFQTPKLAFFQPEIHSHVGAWEVVDIGLDKHFLSEASTNYFMTEEAQIKTLLPPRKKFMHKGSAGRVQLWVGGAGKMGAAQLASKACLRSGAGLVFVKTPIIGRHVMQLGVPEAMVDVDEGEEYIATPVYLSDADVIGIGPGIGTQGQTAKALEQFLLRDHEKQLVLDADALNLIALNPQLLSVLPPGAILTPHPGEFRRLAGEWSDDFHKLDLLRDMASRFQLNIVLKGAFSAVALKDGRVFFNPTGNPGMASAGSGDVLFGIICGLLAQNISPEHALLAGVYLHGLSGDLVKTDKGEYSLIASDLVEFLPKAFLAIQH